MNYKELAQRLKSAPDYLLLHERKTALFYWNNDVNLIFYSHNPESEPQEPIEGWEILKEVTDPEGKEPTIIVCYTPPLKR